MSPAILPIALNVIVDGTPVTVGMGPPIALAAVTVLAVFVALPWMFLHYLTRARTSGALSNEEARMLEDLWRTARTMERRVETLEQIMDADAPASPLLRPDYRKGEVH